MRKFTHWSRWGNRDSLSADLKLPGIYALAVTTDDLSGRPFEWREDVVYVGMTNAKGGLRSRLRQFDRTIAGGDGHGGGCRVRYVHRDYNRLVRKLFVAVRTFDCKPGVREPDNLRTMGEVAKAEYVSFAEYAQRYGDLPQFNRPESKKLKTEDVGKPR